MKELDFERARATGAHAADVLIPARDVLHTYAIYERPRDFPNSYVLRRWNVENGQIRPDPLPMAVALDLETVRAALPSGVVKVTDRQAQDPGILEEWI